MYNNSIKDAADFIMFLRMLMNLRYTSRNEFLTYIKQLARLSAVFDKVKKMLL